MSPPEFRLLEGEKYRTVFAKRCVEKRAKWNENSKMCPRWWILATCYADCKNVESHVPLAELSSENKQDFINFLAAARRGV